MINKEFSTMCIVQCTYKEISKLVLVRFLKLRIKNGDVWNVSLSLNYRRMLLN